VDKITICMLVVTRDFGEHLCIQ